MTKRSDFQLPVRTSIDADARVIAWDPTDPNGEPFVAPVSVVGANAAFTTRYTRDWRAQQALTARLRNTTLGGSVDVTVVADSTSNGDTDWLELWLASYKLEHPAWSFRSWLWNDAAQRYLRPRTRQIGTAGESYVTCTTGGISTPDSANVSFTTTDIRLHAKITMSDLIVGERVIASHFGSAGQRAWRWYFQSSTMRFGYSVDGTALVETVVIDWATLTAGLTVSDTDPFCIGISVDLTDGSNAVFQAFRSTDEGATWSAIGSAVTGVIIDPGFFDATSETMVGIRSSSVAPLLGRVYWVEAFRGLVDTGAPAWRFDASEYDANNVHTDALGAVWTLEAGATHTRGAPLVSVLNGSHPGGTIAYHSDATRLAIVNAAPSDVTIVNLGHNDVATTLANYVTLVGSIVTRNPNTSIIISTQNPQHSTATNYRRHATLMERLRQVAAREGWSVIDAYGVILATGNADGHVAAADVHPTALGYTVWAAAAAASFA